MANDDQGGQAAESALIRGPHVPEMSTAGNSDATEPSPVMVRAWNAFLAETPYGRKLAGTWARRIDGLREDREMVTAARRARRERREAEAAAAVAREKMRAAERDALIAQKRLEATEAKR